MEGWIKIHRKMLEWEWYNDNNTKVLFLHLLLTANHKDKKWQGETIKRGQKITSLQHLAEETNLSVRQVRTSLNKLKSTNELTIKTTSRFTLITIEKYSDYQDKDEEDDKVNDKQDDKQTTNKRQTNDKQTTTNKNEKNDKNEKNKRNNKEKPTIDEIQKYISEKNLKVDAKQFFNYFEEGNWIDSKGNKVKNWKQKLLTWNKYSTDTKAEKKNQGNFSQRQYDNLDELLFKGE